MTLQQQYPFYNQSSNNLTIALDVDDVIADLVTEWVRLYNLDHDDDLVLDDIQHWNIANYVKPEVGQKIFDYLLTPGLYDNVQEIPGALTGVETLRNAGFSIVFATASYSESKLEWLYQHRLLQSRDEIIFLSDKSLVRADIIVDDRYETIQKFPGHAILFSRPWNYTANWSWRANNWNDVIRLVNEFAAGVFIPGLGKSVPVVVNELGGMQSLLNYRFDLIDPLPLFRLASIVSEGAEKYGEWNWRRISLRDNLNHALAHIFAHLAGDCQDDHLGHAFCRLYFALSLEMTPGISPRMLPDK